jgi:hypothetical protein
VEVLKGIMFVMILLFETFYGRFGFFQPRLALLVDREEERTPPQQLQIGDSRLQTAADGRGSDHKSAIQNLQSAIRG